MERGAAALAFLKAASRSTLFQAPPWFAHLTVLSVILPGGPTGLICLEAGGSGSLKSGPSEGARKKKERIKLEAIRDTITNRRGGTGLSG